MSIKIYKKTFQFSSTDGENEIYARCWRPEQKADIRGIVQIVHGGGEHSGRYEKFANYLCMHGFAAYACDILGHGKTVPVGGTFGYFAENDGWKIVIADLQNFTKFIKNDCPGLPVFLYSFGIGSLFARRLASLTSRDYAGIILSGTYSIPSAGKLNLRIAQKAVKKHGEKGTSDYLDNLYSTPYHAHFKHSKTDYDWLTSDEERLDNFINDPLCAFRFTSSMYVDFYMLLLKVSSKSWFKRLPVTMPILMQSGTEDPVGRFGRGVKDIYSEFRKTNHNSVEFRLYKDARHHLMLEKCRDNVCADILNWLNSYVE